MKQGLIDAGIIGDYWYEKHHWGYFFYGSTPVSNRWISLKFAGNGTDRLDLDECAQAFKEFLEHQEGK